MTVPVSMTVAVSVHCVCLYVATVYDLVLPFWLWLSLPCTAVVLVSTETAGPFAGVCRVAPTGPGPVVDVPCGHGRAVVACGHPQRGQWRLRAQAAGGVGVAEGAGTAQ